MYLRRTCSVITVYTLALQYKLTLVLQCMFALALQYTLTLALQCMLGLTLQYTLVARKTVQK